MVDLNTLNPQQRQAAETINGPVLILAGAGTGKTRVITFRIAHMIARGISPDNILAVTFTNKAAREMQQRAGKLIPRARTNASEKPPRPTICTFHSLCVRILRQHIEKLGYKRNFVIYDDMLLTVSEDERDLAAALRAGARGYLLKTMDSDMLASAILRTMQGDSVVSPEMTGKL